MRALRLSILFLLLFSGVTFAEDKADEEKTRAGEMRTHVLEPVTVTATKREERLEKVPASMSTVSDVEIEEMGAWKLGEVLDTGPRQAARYPGRLAGGLSRPSRTGPG
ncbi:MAG: hypothetical protein AAGU21_19305 [Solidesulfovibrio sp.]|uniref:hypothetical protein n=1 Tax=Solidesulfovibrio sp. TaxID=2910990 RepID=UPI002B1ED192|nr:hypothetical protein [Solidesulfovibrio sp.]MEA4855393.1 hypothetical protein [Solidesulfovibrio sp.]